MYEDEPQEPEFIADVEVDDKTLDGSIKISVELKADEITNVVGEHLHHRLNEYVRYAIQTEVKKLLEARSYYQKEGEVNEVMKAIIKEVVREKFDQVYPDAVTNQLNKMVEEVKKITLFDGGNKDRTVTGLKDTVTKKIDAMLQAEIKPIIAEQARHIQEQVQQNFAQNFIRTMIPLGITPPS